MPVKAVKAHASPGTQRSATMNPLGVQAAAAVVVVATRREQYFRHFRLLVCRHRYAEASGPSRKACDARHCHQGAAAATGPTKGQPPGAYLRYGQNHGPYPRRDTT